VAEQLGWFQVQLREGVRRRAQLRHHRGGLGSMAHDVADDDPGPGFRQGDDVVPVAADNLPRGGQASGGDLDSRGYRGLDGEEAVLQRVGDGPLPQQRQGVGDAGAGTSRQPGGRDDVRAADRCLADPAGERQEPGGLFA
jgi:hypothetical protein